MSNIDPKVLEMLFAQQKEHFDKSLQSLSDNIDLKFTGVYRHIEANTEVQNQQVEFLKTEYSDNKEACAAVAEKVSKIETNCAHNAHLYNIFDGPKKYLYFFMLSLFTALIVVVLNDVGISKLLIFLR